jgi:hypothetical protein
MDVLKKVAAKPSRLTSSVIAMLFVAVASCSAAFAQTQRTGGPTPSAPGAEVYFIDLKDGMSRQRPLGAGYLARIKIGQVATITSRAFSHPITGKAVRIFKNDVLNVDPAARADARLVEAWIDLEDAILTERLTNLTVDVVINTGDGGVAVARLGQP